MKCKVSQDDANQAQLMSLNDQVDAAIEAKATYFHDMLTAQKIIKSGGLQYHYDDFIADTEIDPYFLFRASVGDNEPLRNFLYEALYKWCEDLAKESILQ